MIVPNYSQFGGRHCETGSLKNVLAHYRIAAPHTRRTFSEEMLFGIGGGIGMMYWLFEFGGTPVFFVGTRHSDAKALMIEEVCKRLGIAVSRCETTSAKRGAADLEAVLSAGRPAPVCVDMPYLPYLMMPEDAHFGGHFIVVYGIDDKTGEALIADRAHGAMRAPLEALAAARGSKFKPFPPRHKLFEIEPPQDPIESKTLERAVLRGISDCCHQLLHGPIQNIGLDALLKWATLLTHPKNPKGWRKVFAKPMDLYGALISTFIFIEIGGTGGSGFRSMYAVFLDEAAGVLHEPRLTAVAERYRHCARLWSAVATAALPDSVPELKRTRELFFEKNRVFEDQPPGAHEKLLATTRAIDALTADIKKRFPVEPKRVPELLEGIAAAIAPLHEAEVEAATELEMCIR
jgi:hypothetical protein